TRPHPGNGARSMSTGRKVRTTAAGKPGVDGQLDSLEFLRASLASVQTNIFLGDTDFRLFFANERALATLRGMESEIQKAFRLRVDDIVGGSIPRFHQNPQAVERILRNPAALPHETKFTFGSITLQTRINGIFGPGRKLLGYIVNWEDVSEMLKAERTIQEG